jgi:ERCC4-related helicase
MPGVLYRHDGFQATVAAATVALDAPHTLLVLPTNCGKTFIIGVIAHYAIKVCKKTVIIVVPSDELKA